MHQVPPARIGKYEVLELLGRGGMGVVYKAVDPQIGRLVAIKILLTEFEGEEMLKRFYSEARSTGRLQHPNIVTLYELGDQQGAPYLVMEFLAGESLDKMVAAQRRLPLTDTINVVTQVCAGLQYAHERSIIHRDIKPGNVVLLPEGTVKLVDFGIAKFGNEKNTRTGMVFGSVKYMSPEQINGGTIDARSDIYSTGVLLYELVTHRVPFEGQDIVSTIHKVLNQPVPEIADSVPGIPRRLDEILKTALAKAPEDRYESAEDFAFDLVQLQGSMKQDQVREFLDEARAAIGRRDWNAATNQLQMATRADRQNQEAHDLGREIRIATGSSTHPDRVRAITELAERAAKRNHPTDVLRLCSFGLELDPGCTRLLQMKEEARDSAASAALAASAANVGAAADPNPSVTRWGAAAAVPAPPSTTGPSVQTSTGSGATPAKTATIAPAPEATAATGESAVRSGRRWIVPVGAATVIAIAGAVSFAVYRSHEGHPPPVVTENHSVPGVSAAESTQPQGPAAPPPETKPEPARKPAPAQVDQPARQEPASTAAPAQSPDAQAWQKMGSSPSVADLDRFLQTYPNSPLRAQAENRREDLVWGRAQATGDPSALNGYLSRYPAGKYASAARAALAQADRQKIESANDPVTLEAYLNRYPTGDLHTLVINRLDDVTWAQTAKDAIGANVYLSRFPNGQHAADARGILETARTARPTHADSGAAPAGSAHGPSAPAHGADDDKTAILAILSAYQQAYNHQNLAGIERVWPNMPSQQKNSTNQLFKQVKFIQMNFEVLSGPDITGTDATVNIAESVNFSTGGATQTRATKVQIKLTKSAGGGDPGGWRIESILQ